LNTSGYATAYMIWDKLESIYVGCKLVESKSLKTWKTPGFALYYIRKFNGNPLRFEVHQVALVRVSKIVETPNG
jgi:hypothetical protein